jgi:hypothetical protein
VISPTLEMGRLFFSLVMCDFLEKPLFYPRDRHPGAYGTETGPHLFVDPVRSPRYSAAHGY